MQSPVPLQFNTREFRRSDGAPQHNAASAWAQGATGAGVTIAVIDTGIDPDSPEFAGRISPASRDIVGTRSLEGTDDHGTLVALVSSAARDNTGVLGVAFDSTILAIRADEPGSCDAGGGGSAGEGCLFSDTAVADGIDYAAANGADVVNISLGGGGGISTRLRNSVRNAVNAGVLIVIAAGNDGNASLDGFATQLAAAGNGGLLVVGSVDEDFAISDFSNRPGTQTQNFLTARGEAVCCVYEDGQLFVDSQGFSFLYSGTSFATPQVSGAAALLAQAFPNLTGREIAEILLISAFDAGAPGDDAVFGQGILDIAAAFRPIGTTSLAGSQVPLGLGDITATGSPAIGDALSTASIPTLITDRFGRAFATDLGGTSQGAAPRQLLHGAVASSSRHVAANAGRASLSFSFDDPDTLAPLRLSFDAAEQVQAQVQAAQITLQIAPQTQLALGYATSGQGLATGLRGGDRPAFMIAGDAASASGLYSQSEAAIALRRQWGGWGVSLSAESGAIGDAPSDRRFDALRSDAGRDRLARLGLALDRRLGDIDIVTSVNWLGEERSVLGARFHEAFGLAGADSVFLDNELAWRFAPAWRLGMSWREGLTRPRAAALVDSGTGLQSRAFAFDLSREGVLAAGDALALRVSQPLRVEGGALALRLPVDYDYANAAPVLGRVPVSLTPDGRELTGELAWRGPWLGGFAGASLFYRRDPGHYAALPDDAGLAIRWSRRF